MTGNRTRLVSDAKTADLPAVLWCLVCVFHQFIHTATKSFRTLLTVHIKDMAQRYLNFVNIFLWSLVLLIFFSQVFFGSSKLKSIHLKIQLVLGRGKFTYRFSTMTSVALGLLDTSLFHFHFHPFPLMAEDSFVTEGVTLRRNMLSSAAVYWYCIIAGW